eukprot:m.130575 g.130575  ORF g.130575 m.130575 type:complete len:677 (+) comp17473_c0_seq2:394-2424(+)
MNAADTQVLLSQRVAQKDVTIGGVVQIEELLKLMDRAACLSAERLAKQPCVTLSMDDLRICASCPLGHHIIIEARVHRAFNTSMEVGVHIDCINYLSDTAPVFVCEAFFTFVAVDTSGAKIHLPPVNPVSPEEHRQHVLAGERRRLRFTAKATVQAAIDATTAAQSPNAACAMHVPSRAIAATPPSPALLGRNRRRIDELETMELVFPHHVQHHGTTFGGEIMAWVFSNAEHVAEAYANGPVRAHYLDEVWFRQKSTVGDRLRFRSRVNYTCGRSLEVGVRVDAWEVGGQVRHITSAFLVFEADHVLQDVRHHAARHIPAQHSDTPAQSVQNMPHRDCSEETIVGHSASSSITTTMRRYAAAQGRAVIRSQRTSLRLRLFPLSVPLSLVSVPDQCYANVLQAVTLHTSSDWHPLCTDAANAVHVAVRQDVRWSSPAENADVATDVAGVRVQPTTSTEADIHDEYFVRFETTVPCDHATVSNFLLRPETRAQWDHDVRSNEVVHHLDENNAITRVVMKNATSAPCDLEFVLLRSVATAGSLRTIAFRSVELDSGPYADAYAATVARAASISAPGCVRGAVVTASFVVSKSGACTLMQHYYHVPKQFLTADIAAALRGGVRPDTTAATTEGNENADTASTSSTLPANPWLQRTVAHFVGLRNLLIRSEESENSGSLPK